MNYLQNTNIIDIPNNTDITLFSECVYLKNNNTSLTFNRNFAYSFTFDNATAKIYTFRGMSSLNPLAIVYLHSSNITIFGYPYLTISKSTNDSFVHINTSTVYCLRNNDNSANIIVHSDIVIKQLWSGYSSGFFLFECSANHCRITVDDFSEGRVKSSDNIDFVVGRASENNVIESRLVFDHNLESVKGKTAIPPTEFGDKQSGLIKLNENQTEYNISTFEEAKGDFVFVLNEKKIELKEGKITLEEEKYEYKEIPIMKVKSIEKANFALKGVLPTGMRAIFRHGEDIILRVIFETFRVRTHSCIVEKKETGIEKECPNSTFYVYEGVEEWQKSLDAEIKDEEKEGLNIIYSNIKDVIEIDNSILKFQHLSLMNGNFRTKGIEGLKTLIMIDSEVEARDKIDILCDYVYINNSNISSLINFERSKVIHSQNIPYPYQNEYILEVDKFHELTIYNKNLTLTIKDATNTTFKESFTLVIRGIVNRNNPITINSIIPGNIIFINSKCNIKLKDSNRIIQHLSLYNSNISVTEEILTGNKHVYNFPIQSVQIDKSVKSSINFEGVSAILPMDYFVDGNLDFGSSRIELAGTVKFVKEEPNLINGQNTMTNVIFVKNFGADTLNTVATMRISDSLEIQKYANIAFLRLFSISFNKYNRIKIKQDLDFDAMVTVDIVSFDDFLAPHFIFEHGKIDPQISTLPKENRWISIVCINPQQEAYLDEMKFSFPEDVNYTFEMRKRQYDGDICMDICPVPFSAFDVQINSNSSILWLSVISLFFIFALIFGTAIYLIIRKRNKRHNKAGAIFEENSFREIM